MNSKHNKNFQKMGSQFTWKYTNSKLLLGSFIKIESSGTSNAFKSSVLRPGYQIISQNLSKQRILGKNMTWEADRNDILLAALRCSHGITSRTRDFVEGSLHVDTCSASRSGHLITSHVFQVPFYK